MGRYMCYLFTISKGISHAENYGRRSIEVSSSACTCVLWPMLDNSPKFVHHGFELTLKSFFKDI